MLKSFIESGIPVPVQTVTKQASLERGCFFPPGDFPSGASRILGGLRKMIYPFSSFSDTLKWRRYNRDPINRLIDVFRGECVSERKVD